MWGDAYIIRTGLETERTIKPALAFFLTDSYRNAGRPSPMDWAIAVTNAVFGDRPVVSEALQFAEQNRKQIDLLAKDISTDNALCRILTGAAYNIGYGRYTALGMSRGPLSNTFLAYTRALSNFDNPQNFQITLNIAEKLGEKGADSAIRPFLALLGYGIFRPLRYGPNERAHLDGIRAWAAPWWPR